MTALRELAQTRCLPDHQVMDQTTLEWITENRPAGPAAPGLPDRLLILVPEATWFVHAELVDSIHGARHNGRVSLLVSLLARQTGLDGDETAALCAAAAVHDCRRHNDRDDPGHGQRAAAWLMANPGPVTTALRRHVPRRLLGSAVIAIALHDIPYESFTDQQTADYERCRPMVDLLKAADALDRYRLPLRRWWPDLTRLRVQIPTWLPPLSHDLVVASERARLDGASHQEALDQALQAVNG